MSYHPRTPFRRAYDAAQLKDFAPIPETKTAPDVNKWDVLRELGVARKQFNLSDRTLSVLQALLGFHSETELSISEKAPIVYPANATICERLNGMPCSTMRRHLASLVKAGLLIRRDSPNGKRYTRTFAGTAQAFGFDLTPLVIRFQEIKDAADEVRKSEAHVEQLRLNASLMRRDLAALSELARAERPALTIWDAFDDLALLFARELRRKLSATELEELNRKLAASLTDLQALISELFADEMSTNEVQNEQHHQNSNIELEDTLIETPHEITNEHETKTRKAAKVSLQMVSTHCKEMRAYFSEPLNKWSDLVHVVDRLRPMMGVSLKVWDRATEAMGLEQASVVLAVMLERFEEIRSPSGYLQHLTNKAELGTFSCNPMLLALARRTGNSQL
ncbi:plasmid replication protein RepC [Planktotalea sp.]|uniref:plasmid replication protein RepC n=1 Tax=Planktotalea sp. TaxID=2029877 RepID=UPI0032990679